jgi:hypothetical protein
MKVVSRTALVHDRVLIACKTGVIYRVLLQIHPVRVRVLGPGHSRLHAGTIDTIKLDVISVMSCSGALMMSNACSAKASALSTCFSYVYILCWFKKTSVVYRSRLLRELCVMARRPFHAPRLHKISALSQP